MRSPRFNNKKGYAHHPEMLRWKEFLSALALRHDLLVAEMTLRGYRHNSPLPLTAHHERWPTTYVDPPEHQFLLLREKYRGREPGRIRLPKNAQQLWAQHKYSVLARDPKLYQEIGRRLADKCVQCAQFAQELTELLRRPPSPGGLRNAIEHMWGYVSEYAVPDERRRASRSLLVMLKLTQQLAREHSVLYLWHSTALSELDVWIERFKKERDYAQDL